jgi:hypothetical protein
VFNVPSERRPWGSPPIGPAQFLESLPERNGITIDFCRPPKSLLDTQRSHHLFDESAANCCHVDEPIAHEGHADLRGWQMWAPSGIPVDMVRYMLALSQVVGPRHVRSPLRSLS